MLRGGLKLIALNGAHKFVVHLLKIAFLGPGERFLMLRILGIVLH